jgi:hypothetical protein
MANHANSDSCCAKHLAVMVQISNTVEQLEGQQARLAD